MKDLHTVWDSALIEHEGLSFTEFAEFLEADLGEEPVAQATPADWAQESIDVRFEVYEVYDRTDRTNHLPDLAWNYSHDHGPLVARRLYQGGRRLAGLLNSIYE